LIEGKVQIANDLSCTPEWQPDLEISVIDGFDGRNGIVIIYCNHEGDPAAEPGHFNATGLVRLAAACHRHD
jgi:hypothetical protein